MPRMIPTKMGKVLKRIRVRGCYITLTCLFLNGCGFLTAPVGLASAEIASSSVKAANVSL